MSTWLRASSKLALRARARAPTALLPDLQHQPAGLGARLELGIAPLLRIEPGAEQQLRHAENAVHRGADFVAHVGQKLPVSPSMKTRH